ncbi:hypothetical protein V6N11_022667 [Hibiscus sabdariffa]|uniref:Uncharacterized protein n=1 Tax=Hibiscus sabdariffa TaxID=183260 RepID=A0ABR2TJX1_9ROSI
MEAKHRRLDDEPHDTGDPKSAVTESLHDKDIKVQSTRLLSYKDKLMENLRVPSEEEEFLDDDEIEILEKDVTRSVIDGSYPLTSQTWFNNS